MATKPTPYYWVHICSHTLFDESIQCRFRKIHLTMNAKQELQFNCPENTRLQEPTEADKSE